MRQPIFINLFISDSTTKLAYSHKTLRVSASSADVCVYEFHKAVHSATQHPHVSSPYAGIHQLNYFKKEPLTIPNSFRYMF